MGYTVRKQFKFEASHRLTSSYSKCCQVIHGHSYLLEVFISADFLNADGMIEDFGRISDVVKARIIDLWDHKLILSSKDSLVNTLSIDGIVIVPFNPTAENMAKHIYDTLIWYFPDLKCIRIHETQTGWAEYTG